MNFLPEKRDWKPWLRAALGRIKSDPGLRRAHRRARPSWSKKRTFELVALRPFVTVAFAMIAFMSDVQLGVALNFLVLWTLWLTLNRAHQLAHAFHNPQLLSLLYGWPLSNDAVFAHQWRPVLRASYWLGADWLVFTLACAIQQGDPALAGAAPLVAAAQWAVSLGIALWAVRGWPRLPYGLMGWPLMVGIFVGGRMAAGSPVIASYVAIGWKALYVATPGGWLAQIWLNLADGHPLAWSLLLGAAALGGFAVKHGIAATRKAFDLDRFFGYEDAPETLGADASDTPQTTVENNLPAQSVRAAAADDFFADAAPDADALPVAGGKIGPRNLRFVHKRVAWEFGLPAGLAMLKRGVVEQALGWFLTRKERALVDFMVPAGRSWHRGWLMAAAFLSVAAALRFSDAEGWAFAPALAAVFAVMPVAGGRWLGFEAMKFYQTQMGLLAHVPVGFAALAGLVLKVNALRCATAFPILLVAVWLGWPAEMTPGIAADFALRISLLVIAAQPIWLITKLSANTNDSSGAWYYVGAMLAGILLALILSVSLVVTSLMAETWPVGAGCAAAFALLTHGVLSVYGLAWNRGWFDLIAKIKAA